MKVWDCQQNTHQWHELRRFIPTASEMHRIVCPEPGSIYKCSVCGYIFANARKWCDQCSKKQAAVDRISVMKLSAQADAYMYRLIAQSFGAPIQESPLNKYMEQGHEREADAAAQYELLTDRDTKVVGFCTTDDGLIGASPDRLVGDDGLLECKCPADWTHIRHLASGDLESDHKVQLQAQMLVTGRKWADVISFVPGWPTIIIRVERDEEFIGGMNDLLVEFISKMHRTRAELIAKHGDFTRLPQVPKHEPEFGLDISPADVAAIYAAGTATRSEEW